MAAILLLFIFDGSGTGLALPGLQWTVPPSEPRWTLLPSQPQWTVPVPEENP